MNIGKTVNGSDLEISRNEAKLFHSLKQLAQ